MAPPLNATFIHRQTLAGQVRFTTDRARRARSQDRHRRRSRAGARARDFRSPRRPVDRGERADQGGGRGARDASTSPRRWRRSRSSAIMCGRRSTTASLSPSPAAAIRWSSRRSAHDGGPFVANDCDLSPPPARARAGRPHLADHRPEHGGQIDLPAPERADRGAGADGQLRAGARAHIGVVDRLFSRVGAADDLARGRSTFMVEMVETAAILNQAGARALVILDEIGRGTATFDGLSIAWATIEHLHESNRCRALFATHFHEMTALAAKLPRLTTPPCGSRNGRATSCSCTKSSPAPPTAPTASRWRSSPACRASVIERAKLVLAAARGRGPHLAGAPPDRRPAAVPAARAAPASPPPDPAAEAW